MGTPGENELEKEFEFEKSPNPNPFKPNPPEHPAVAKARLFQWHYVRGTMGIYYDLYPEDRPAAPEPRPTLPRGRAMIRPAKVCAAGSPRVRMARNCRQPHRPRLSRLCPIDLGQVEFSTASTVTYRAILFPRGVCPRLPAGLSAAASPHAVVALLLLRSVVPGVSRLGLGEFGEFRLLGVGHLDRPSLRPPTFANRCSSSRLLLLLLLVSDGPVVSPGTRCGAALFARSCFSRSLMSRLRSSRSSRARSW